MALGAWLAGFLCYCCCMVDPAVVQGARVVVGRAEELIEGVQSKGIHTVVVNASGLDLVPGWLLSSSPVRIEGATKTIRGVPGRPRPILDLGQLVSMATQNLPEVEMGITATKFMNSSAVLRFKRVHITGIDLQQRKPTKNFGHTYIFEDCILELHNAPGNLIAFVKKLSQNNGIPIGLENFCRECESLESKGLLYTINGPIVYPINVRQNLPRAITPGIEFSKVLLVFHEKREEAAEKPTPAFKSGHLAIVISVGSVLGVFTGLVVKLNRRMQRGSVELV